MSTKQKKNHSYFKIFSHIDLPELCEAGAQYWRNSQHAVLHVHQPTHAVIHDYVARVQVAVK